MGNNLSNNKVETIDANTKGGIFNYIKYCSYSTNETFGTTDPKKMVEKMSEILKYNNSDMKERVDIELKNLIQGFNSAMKCQNWELNSFLALVKTINGEFVQHEPEEVKLQLMPWLSINQMKEGLEGSKKKSNHKLIRIFQKIKAKISF